MDDCVAITLLRHGMTKENERKAYIGWTDSPLSEKGKEALRLIDHSFQPDVTFSSPLLRCTETAEILFPHQEIHCVPDMKEMNFGIFEGKTYEQLKGETSYINWLSDPFSGCPPDGESFHAFTKRIGRGWREVVEKILETNASSAVIVTHGGVIRHLLTTYTPGSKSFFEWQIPHGAGYQLNWSKEDLRRNEKCMSLQEVPTMEKKTGSKRHMN